MLSSRRNATCKRSKTDTLLKWHGGKGYLAGSFWDIALADGWRPMHVVEPFCGGASFTLEGLARGLPFSFCINDLSREVTNFWKTLQSPSAFGVFCRRVEATPFSQAEWKEARLLLGQEAYANAADPERAAQFFVFNRQSLAGRMKGFTGITKTRTRRRMNNEVSAWLSAVDGLREFHVLLKQVLVLDAQPAVDVIRKHDTPGTLQYLDPPYVHTTRSTTGEYAHEMTDEQHMELLNACHDRQGRIMISGYPSPLYDNMLKGWTRHTFDLPNNAAGGPEKDRKTEVLWCNWLV